MTTMSKLKRWTAALVIIAAVLVAAAAVLAVVWSFDILVLAHWSVLADTLGSLVDGRASPTGRFAGFMAVLIGAPVAAATAGVAGYILWPRLDGPLAALRRVLWRGARLPLLPVAFLANLLFVAPFRLLRCMLPRIERGPTQFALRDAPAPRPVTAAHARPAAVQAPRADGPEAPIVLTAGDDDAEDSEPFEETSAPAPARPTSASPAFLAFSATPSADTDSADAPPRFGMPMTDGAEAADDETPARDDLMAARIVLQSLKIHGYKVVPQISCDGERHGPFTPTVSGGEPVMTIPLLALSSTGADIIVVRDLGGLRGTVAADGDGWAWTAGGDHLPCPVTEARQLHERFLAHYGPELDRHGLQARARVILSGVSDTMLPEDLFDAWDAAGVVVLTTEADDILAVMGPGDDQVSMDLLNHFTSESASARARLSAAAA